MEGWLPRHVVPHVARQQHGVVSTRQVNAAGLGPNAIAGRVASGWLRPMHRGVYAVGVLETELTRPAAALLAAAGGAALSHRTAAVIWRLLPTRADDPVELTLFKARGRNKQGVRVHHARLTAVDLRRRHGLQLTAPARTLLDLAASSPRDLEEALNEARDLRLATPGELSALLERCPRHRGARVLRQATEDGPDLTRSEAERRLLALIRAAGLPTPRTNVRIEGRRFDRRVVTSRR